MHNDYTQSQNVPLYFFIGETAKFPTIFIYKVVITVLFTYLPYRDAVRINEIIPTKNLSSLGMGDIECYYYPVIHTLACSLFQDLKVESNRNKF